MVLKCFVDGVILCYCVTGRVMVLKCFVDGVILCYWQSDGVEMFCWSNPVLLAG